VNVTGAASRAAVHSLLRRMTRDTLTVRERGSTRSYGPGGEGALHAEVEVRDPRAWSAIARHGSAGLGRSFFEGWWHSDDPTVVVRVIIRNLGPLDALRERFGRPVRRIGDPLRSVPARSDPQRDRRQVRAHYDLGNDFYELMLDETMMYSCALFEQPGATLFEAQVAKLALVGSTLRLGPDDHVVEIGTGWGGFAHYAAERYGCRVTTTTVSERQYEYARSRIKTAGLEDRVTVLDLDYRDLTGQFDALVSLEMIEAVDWRDHDTFFSSCASLLRPEGRMLLQAITVPDQRFERTKNTVDFIKRHVFPGGCLPSLGAIVRSTGSATDLSVIAVRDIGTHYAETLRRWRQNFDATTGELPALGFDERFERLWRFYLCYCEAAFEERHVSDVHVLLARPAWRDSPAVPAP
jgi:cyclopropane-fatty-acyl-phospholipid synthase